MKKAIIFILLCLLALSSCNAEAPPAETTPGTSPDTSSVTTPPVTSAAQETAPQTNAQLFEYIISKWKQNCGSELYQYASPQLAALMNEADFAYMFDSVSYIGGALNKVSDKRTNAVDGVTLYSALLEFDRITAELTVGLKGLQICSFTRNVHFNDSFELDRGDGVIERYFVLENEGCKLNAVYTYVGDGQSHPAVLLIPGSGPADYNSTVGLLTPFEDIALGLARNGINSLRLDKRTLNYPSATGIEIGIEQEYLSDCAAAIEYLKGQQPSGLYLLGHSLGGQIATALAARDSAIDGMILYNSSLRHLADIACGQYSAMDPANRNVYRAYADGAKAVTSDIIRGYYYFGATDTYWASYNKLDTAQSIAAAGIGTLVINSKADRQLFDEDLELWEVLAASDPNVTLRVLDGMSHFGYVIDTSDPAAVYRHADFPPELIRVFSDFINGNR